MAVETTIQGKNVVVFENSGSLNFEFVDGHSVPEGSYTLVESGPVVWDSVALLNGGFEVIWDSAVGASPTAQNYDNNGNPVGGTYMPTGAIPTASYASTSLELPMATSNSQANTQTWTTVLPND